MGAIRIESEDSFTVLIVGCKRYSAAQYHIVTILHSPDIRNLGTTESALDG